MTVLLQASLTTTPCSTRFDITSSLGRLALPFAEHGLDACDVSPYLPHPGSILKLAVRALEAQIEDLFPQIVELAGQLVGGLGSDIGRFHEMASAPSRATNRVPMGNLAEANSKASRAVPSATPSSSNMIRPGLTLQIQNSGDPLPLPI